MCVSAAVDVPAMDAHVYAALASGDLTVEQLNELTLHFAVYCGWPRASQLEMTVRAQWQRIHDERGEPACIPRPDRRRARRRRPTRNESRAASPASRRSTSSRLHRRTRRTSTPGSSTSCSVTSGSAPGSRRRDRRLITIPCVGVGDAIGPIWSHVTSALGSGDVTYDEMQEIIVHFSAYAGTPRAERAPRRRTQWQAADA